MVSWIVILVIAPNSRLTARPTLDLLETVLMNLRTPKIAPMINKICIIGRSFDDPGSDRDVVNSSSKNRGSRLGLEIADG